MDDESGVQPTDADGGRPRFTRPMTPVPAPEPTRSAPNSSASGPSASATAGRHPRTTRGFRADPPAPPSLAASATGPGSTTQDEPGSVADRQAGSLRRRLGAAIRRPVAATAITLVGMLVIGILAFRLGTNSSPARSTAQANTAASSSSTPSALAVAEIYSLALPSVVAITTSKGSLGTGFVVTDTGTLMTANHVISDGGTITVHFADGTKSAARVDSADAATDIALLTPGSLPEVVVPATLGGGAAVGADVVAIGNQLGLADSTTSGIVSGLNRTATTKAGKLSGLIQFDAAVNPGSSGGPLLDTHGAVIGVVVSIADPGKDDSWSGIGFAVPIGSALGATGDGAGGGPQL